MLVNSISSLRTNTIRTNKSNATTNASDYNVAQQQSFGSASTVAKKAAKTSLLLGAAAAAFLGLQSCHHGYGGTLDLDIEETTPTAPTNPIQPPTQARQTMDSMSLVAKMFGVEPTSYVAPVTGANGFSTKSGDIAGFGYKNLFTTCSYVLDQDKTSDNSVVYKEQVTDNFLNKNISGPNDTLTITTTKDANGEKSFILTHSCGDVSTKYIMKEDSLTTDDFFPTILKSDKNGHIKMFYDFGDGDIYESPMFYSDLNLTVVK